jgi:hypothetical protein
MPGQNSMEKINSSELTAKDHFDQLESLRSEQAKIIDKLVKARKVLRQDENNVELKKEITRLEKEAEEILEKINPKANKWLEAVEKAE